LAHTIPDIKTVNMVASIKILNEDEINLDEIVKKFPDAEYHPEAFPGLVFRTKNPKTAMLIFTTGKMINTGGVKEEGTINAVHSVVDKLYSENIITSKELIIRFVNIVSSINLKGKIHLEQAARTLPRSMYETEQFPGVIHRMLDPKVVMLLFASGKLICTGAKTVKDVYRGVNNLQALLEEKELIDYTNYDKQLVPQLI